MAEEYLGTGKTAVIIFLTLGLVGLIMVAELKGWDRVLTVSLGAALCLFAGFALAFKWRRSGNL